MKYKRKKANMRTFLNKSIKHQLKPCKKRRLKTKLIKLREDKILTTLSKEKEKRIQLNCKIHNSHKNQNKNCMKSMDIKLSHKYFNGSRRKLSKTY